MVTIAPEIPTDVEAVYHELLERLGPAERAELARLLLDDGPLWADYYSETRWPLYAATAGAALVRKPGSCQSPCQSLPSNHAYQMDVSADDLYTA